MNGDVKNRKVEKKRKKEQYVVEEMIRLYCRKKHKGHGRGRGRTAPLAAAPFP